MSGLAAPALAQDGKTEFELYEGEKKEYRRRAKAAYGRVVAAASEGYKARADAEKAIASIKDAAAKAEVVQVKD